MQNKRLKVGDTIKCHDEDDMIKTMEELAKDGVGTDFLYEKYGARGLYLEVTEVEEDGRKES